MFRVVSSLLGYTGNIFIQRCLINRPKCFIFILCLFMCVYAPVCIYGYICAGVCAHAKVRRGCPVSSLTLYSSLESESLPEHIYGLLSAGLEPASSSNPPISSHLRAEAPSFWGRSLSLLHGSWDSYSSPHDFRAGTFDSQATSPTLSGFFNPDQLTIKINILLGCRIE